MGTLINFVEPYLPVLLTQTFRFGKHSYKGAPSRLVQLVEIPKAWFRHFYVSALFVSTACMYIVVHVYVGGYQTPDSLLWLLDVLCGSDREVSCTKLWVLLSKKHVSNVLISLILCVYQPIRPPLFWLCCCCSCNAYVAFTRRTLCKSSHPAVKSTSPTIWSVICTISVLLPQCYRKLTVSFARRAAIIIMPAWIRCNCAIAVHWIMWPLWRFCIAGCSSSNRIWYWRSCVAMPTAKLCRKSIEFRVVAILRWSLLRTWCSRCWCTSRCFCWCRRIRRGCLFCAGCWSIRLRMRG